MIFKKIKKAWTDYLHRLAKINKEEFGEGSLKCKQCGMKCSAQGKRNCSFFDMDVD